MDADDSNRTPARSTRVGRGFLFAGALLLSLVAAPARADTLDTMLSYLVTAGIVDPAVKDAKPLIQCLVNSGNPASCVNVKSLAEQEGKAAVKKYTPDDPMIAATVDIIRAANKSDWFKVLELTSTDVLVQIACKSGLSTSGPLKNFICGSVFKEISHLAKSVVREVLAAMNPPDLWELIGLVGNIDLACKLVPDFPGKDEACGTFGKALAAIGGAAADAVKFGGKLVVSGTDAIENVLFGSDSHMPYDKYYALYWLPWFHKGVALCVGQNCQGLGDLQKGIWDRCVDYFDSHNQYRSTARKTCDDMRDKRFDPGVKAMAKGMKGAGEAHAALMRNWARTWAVEDYGKDTVALRKTSFVSNCDFALRKSFPFPPPDPALCEAMKKSLIYKPLYTKCMGDVQAQLPSPSAWASACTAAQPKFVAVFNEEKGALQQQINQIVAAGCFPPQGWSAAQGLKFECTNYEAYGACLSGLKAGAEQQHCKVDVAKADAERAKQIVAALSTKRCHAQGGDVVCTRPWKVDACKVQLAAYKPLPNVKSGLSCNADLAAFTGLQKQAQQIVFSANGGTKQNTGMKTEKGDGLVMVVPPSSNNCTPQIDPLALKCLNSAPAIAAAKTVIPGGTLGACAPDPKKDGADAPCLAPVMTAEVPTTVGVAQPAMPGGVAGAMPDNGARQGTIPPPARSTGLPAVQSPAVQSPLGQLSSARNAQTTTPTGAAGGFNLPPPPAQSPPPPAAVVARAAAVAAHAQTTGAANARPSAATADVEQMLAPTGCMRRSGTHFTCTSRAGLERCEALHRQQKVQSCALAAAR